MKESLSAPKSLSRKRKTTDMEGKENKVIVHPETAGYTKYFLEYQQAGAAESIRRKEKHMEEIANNNAAIERGKQATRALRMKQTKETEELQKPLQIKQKVLNAEKDRAHFVASLPPRAINPEDEILKKFKSVEYYTTERMGTTKYVPKVDLVERASPSINQCNAKAEAIRIQEFEREEQAKKMKQSEEFAVCANDRFNSAIKKEQLNNEYKNILTELGKAERATRSNEKKKFFRPLEDYGAMKAVFASPIKNNVLTQERELELEKAVEKILREENEIPLQMPDANVTIRRRKRSVSKGTRSPSSLFDSIPLNMSLDELGTPDNDASLKEILGTLRKEREATMKKLRTDPMTPFKDKPFAIRIDLEEYSTSAEFTTNEEDKLQDVFNLGFEDAATSPPFESKQFSSAATQTDEAYKTLSLFNSPFASSPKLLPLADNFESSLNKETQTDIVDRYQKLLLERACKSVPKIKESQLLTRSSGANTPESISESGNSNSEKASDNYSKISPVFSECLKRVVECHLKKDETVTAKKSFFSPLPGLESPAVKGERKTSKLKLSSVKSPSTKQSISSNLSTSNNITGLIPDQPRVKRFFKDPTYSKRDRPITLEAQSPVSTNKDVSKLGLSVAHSTRPEILTKKDVCKEEKVVGSQKLLGCKETSPIQSSEISHQNTETSGKQVNSIITPGKKIFLEIQNSIVKSNEEILPNTPGKSQGLVKQAGVASGSENAFVKKSNTSALLLSCSSNSLSSTSSLSDSNSQNSSSSSTSSSTEIRIPNYVQFRIMNENRQMGFPHGPINTIDELRDLLARLVPSGEELSNLVRPRPPISCPSWINDSLVPHELSTIIEVETPQTSMIATEQIDGTLNKRGFIVPEIKLQLFPEGKTHESRKEVSPISLTTYIEGTQQLSQSSSNQVTPTNSSRQSSSSSTKWSDILKSSKTPPPSSTISSLSSGLVETFSPAKVVSQSTPIKLKDTLYTGSTLGEVTCDDLAKFDLTLIGDEICITEEDKLNPLLTTPQIKSCLKPGFQMTSPFSSNAASPLRANLSGNSGTVNNLSPIHAKMLFRNFSPACASPGAMTSSFARTTDFSNNSDRLKESPLSESMVSFLRHEQSALQNADLSKN